MYSKEKTRNRVFHAINKINTNHTPHGIQWTRLPWQWCINLFLCKQSSANTKRQSKWIIGKFKSGSFQCLFLTKDAKNEGWENVAKKRTNNANTKQADIASYLHDNETGPVIACPISHSSLALVRVTCCHASSTIASKRLLRIHWRSNIRALC